MNALAHRRRKLFALYQMMMALGQIEAPTKWDSFHRKHAFDTRYRNHAFDVFGKPIAGPPTYAAMDYYKWRADGTTYYPSTRTYGTIGFTYVAGQRWRSTTMRAFRTMLWCTLPAYAITEARIRIGGIGNWTSTRSWYLQVRQTYDPQPFDADDAWTYTDRGLVGQFHSSSWSIGMTDIFITLTNLSMMTPGSVFWVLLASDRDLAADDPGVSSDEYMYTSASSPQAYLLMNGQTWPILP
jgi:hypothetical protein